MDASAFVEPIDVAPDRARIELTMVLGGGESLAALLERGGASAQSAGDAAGLIRSAAPSLKPGTELSLVLGARIGDRRPIEQVRLKAGLGITLEVSRSESGALELTRHVAAVDRTPLRIRGRVGDGLYWSLRTAGLTPQSAAEYLQALAAEIDVGSEVAPDDRFDIIIASRRAAGGERQTGPLLYAAIDRSAASDVQLVRWAAGGRLTWVNAADGGGTARAMRWPVTGRITSGFGYRRHPILGFARLHRGIDFGAAWGSPIVAAADGQVVGSGWAGGYGRQVRIAHAGGVMTSYSHMSRITADEGSMVRQGDVIGYVGSSGLSTGPHLHYEVYRGGTPVNPLSVRFAGVTVADANQRAAIKQRLESLLRVGLKGAQG
jgi:murein DD-endopeptidase MepM/ murein hydrolase activator NlpD